MTYNDLSYGVKAEISSLTKVGEYRQAAAYESRAIRALEKRAANKEDYSYLKRIRNVCVNRDCYACGMEATCSIASS